MRDEDVNEIVDEVRALRAELARLRDESEIRSLQYRYGYYDDYRDWERLIALFADSDCSVEIGSRGKYIGKDRVARFFREVIGGSGHGLGLHQVYSHLQLQMIITIDREGRTAKARSRAFIQGLSGENGSLALAEGVYENSYVKVDGVWKIKDLYWAPAFYAVVSGIERIFFAGAPASETFPPDDPPRSPDPTIGRTLIPYHF